MHKLLALVALATIALIMLEQFGPAVVFGSEAAGSDHVRARGR